LLALRLPGRFAGCLPGRCIARYGIAKFGGGFAVVTAFVFLELAEIRDDQAFGAVGDQVGTAGQLQGPDDQSAVFRLGKLQQGALQHLFLEPRDIDGLEGHRIEAGVVHGG
jgi:hypothetical protein